MSAPTNISAATATAVAIPSTTAQRVDFSGTTYTVWYAITPTQPYALIDCWGFGDLAVYKPSLSIFTGPVGSPTAYLIASAQNLPTQIPVTVGTTYYLEFVTNGGNPSPANLTVTITAQPKSSISGGLLVNDDTPAFPGVVISSRVSNSILDSIPNFTAGESMDLLPTGTLAAVSTTGVDFWSVPAFIKTHSIVLASSGIVRATKQGGFICTAAAGVVKALTSAGTVTATYGTSANFADISPDGSIIYYVVDQAVNRPVKRWDTASNTGLSDLVGGVAGAGGKRMLVLGDGTVVVVYVDGGPSTLAKRYSAAGATLNSYTFASSSGTDPRICRALDDPSSFWIWIKQSDGFTSHFVNVVSATGAATATIVGIQYEDGIYAAPATATPLTFFGHSESCDVVVIASDQTTFVGTAATMPIRRERTVPIPVADGNARQTVSRLEVQFQPGTGIVDDPLGEPKFMLQVSWDHGKTWSNERLMNAGREGRYLTRAYVNLVGQGRYPVVRIVTSDTFLPIMTGCSVWITESAH